MRSMSKVLILTMIMFNLCVFTAKAGDFSMIKGDTYISELKEEDLNDSISNMPNFLEFEKALSISTSIKSPQEIRNIVFVRVDNPRKDCFYKFRMIEDDKVKYLDTIDGYEAKIKVDKPKKVEIIISEIRKSNPVDMRTKSIDFKFVEKKEEPLVIKDTALVFDKELIMWNSPKEIILHHAEAKNFSLNKVHELHKNNGWGGIGYHYYIGKDGTIYKGRPERAVGVQCVSKNASSIAICSEGDFNNEQMNERQKTALVKLIKNIEKRYSIKDVKTHRDYNSTDCPGKNFPLEEILKRVNK